jgi:hypothetical protein
MWLFESIFSKNIPLYFLQPVFFVSGQVAKFFWKKTISPYRIQCLILFKIVVKMSILHRKMQKK